MSDYRLDSYYIDFTNASFNNEWGVKALSRKRAQRRRKRLLKCVAFCSLTGMILGSFGYWFVNTCFESIKYKVDLETGSPIDRSIFFNEDVKSAEVLTDLTKINSSVPGKYQITIKLFGKKVTSILDVSDTTAPSGIAVPQTVMAGNIPDVKETVKDLYDLSGTVYVDYSGTPDISHAGNILVPVALTDAYGNTGIINVPFTVLEDTTPPEISGAHDITMVAGDPLKLMEGITVCDDYSLHPSLDVEASGFDSNAAGVYQVAYVATDDQGNVSRQPITITVNPRPDNYVYTEDVYALAQSVYDQIIDRFDYSDVEITMRIFRWAFNNIVYTGHTDTSHWTGGAYLGFTSYHGDCYTSMSCCKALLDIAGIENMCVHGSSNYGNHYWNLVKLEGQWYHCDSTSAHNETDTYLIMLTDPEMTAIYPRYPIVTEGLPERASTSVQSRLDFTNLTIN